MTGFIGQFGGGPGCVKMIVTDAAGGDIWVNGTNQHATYGPFVNPASGYGYVFYAIFGTAVFTIGGPTGPSFDASESFTPSACATSRASTPVVVATPGDGEVVLDWGASTPNPYFCSIGGYSLYRGTSPGAEVPYQLLGDVLTYTDTGVVNGTTYYYKVKALNAEATGITDLFHSALSDEVAATPSASGVMTVCLDGIRIPLD